MRLARLLGEDRRPHARWWPERLAPLLALTGLVLASLPGYNVAGWQDAGSDFKTLYASARCFLTGLRAYNFTNIGRVFDANHVIRPGSWYAHAPTYPPFTFAVMAPVAALPMVVADYVWLGISTLALVLAIWAMASAAERHFALTRPWRLLIIVGVAASPLTSFGLQIGNVSVVAAALCIIAVMCDAGTLHLNWRALALTISLLLKPHIALCLMLGMFLSRNREDRAVVLRTCLFFAAALAAFSLWSFVALPFGTQLGDYTAMVRSEIATGCLNPRNHELLSLPPQVTSFESLLGYSLDSPWMQSITAVVLLGFASCLVFLSRSAPASRAGTRLELLGAWSTFGLLATYHRTHDGVILFLLLPWLLAAISRRRSDLAAWGTLALLILMSVGPDYPGLRKLADQYHSPLAQFLFFRQASVATLLLLLLLVTHLLREVRVPQAAAIIEPDLSVA